MQDYTQSPLIIPKYQNTKIPKYQNTKIPKYREYVIFDLCPRCI
jgi:hypothetical protein